MMCGGCRLVSWDSPVWTKRLFFYWAAILQWFTTTKTEWANKWIPTCRSESVAMLTVEAPVVTITVVPVLLLVLQTISKGKWPLVRKHNSEIILILQSYILMGQFTQTSSRFWRWSSNFMCQNFEIFTSSTTSIQWSFIFAPQSEKNAFKKLDSRNNVTQDNPQTSLLAGFLGAICLAESSSRENYWKKGLGVILPDMVSGEISWSWGF